MDKKTGRVYVKQMHVIVDAGQILPEDCVGVVIDRFEWNIDEPFELDGVFVRDEAGGSAEDERLAGHVSAAQVGDRIRAT